jgi:uncharacterized protein
MNESFTIADKTVLGTVQFGMDYGISNLSGKPSKKEIFNILDCAWENGIRRFDTAPAYDSEKLLGEFIQANGLRNEAIVLTKIPSLEGSRKYKQAIYSSLELSLKKLGCPIEVLFFHKPSDSEMIMKELKFCENLLDNYPVSSLGVSVYETNEVDKLSEAELDIAFQFPFNVLDQRFAKVAMPHGKRYARSIFLQGLLASSSDLRTDAPNALRILQNEYHKILAIANRNPLEVAISFVVGNPTVDYSLIGIDSVKQLQDFMDLDITAKMDYYLLKDIRNIIDDQWLDPRNWS